MKHVRAGVAIKVPGGAPLYYREEDIHEQFVRGGGSGGQSVARTANCVVLIHRPTGMVIRCHATRSRDLNRKKARLELQLRLDALHRGKGSVRGKKALKQQKAKRKKAARGRAKYGGELAATGARVAAKGGVVEGRRRRGRGHFWLGWRRKGLPHPRARYLSRKAYKL